MNTLLGMLLAFVALGLVSHRWRGYTYVVMAVLIVVYVYRAYSHG